MTKPQILYYFFIPLLAVILLLVNFILAPHNPYKEKKTPFECGIHSFLAQNRTQFTISFFIFGLLFMLFDLEITLAYPFALSPHGNNFYGLIIFVIFGGVLGVGFVFELGKKALSFDIKNYSIEAIKQNVILQSSPTFPLGTDSRKRDIDEVSDPEQGRSHSPEGISEINNGVPAYNSNDLPRSSSPAYNTEEQLGPNEQTSAGETSSYPAFDEFINYPDSPPTEQTGGSPQEAAGLQPTVSVPDYIVPPQRGVVSPFSSRTLLKEWKLINNEDNRDTIDDMREHGFKAAEQMYQAANHTSIAKSVANNTNNIEPESVNIIFAHLAKNLSGISRALEIFNDVFNG